ncbi:hypothetical protein TRFO_27102 [Tritrichomonas foetus]|uniref:Uncharacterized protein n=1 Tax=Tritrichomonas foetus TaxID=1144522 RepID=A0A1J4K1C5_9EUKA|nr:hypothetical protein TRFO_27102 [Tritrichomonas foetus]|eukprot:OHT05233.1 hypothetical protein TRFO_27102 [Tritrichomonas foetus]
MAVILFKEKIMMATQKFNKSLNITESTVFPIVRLQLFTLFSKKRNANPSAFFGPVPDRPNNWRGVFFTCRSMLSHSVRKLLRAQSYEQTTTYRAQPGRTHTKRERNFIYASPPQHYDILWVLSRRRITLYDDGIYSWRRSLFSP